MPIDRLEALTWSLACCPELFWIRMLYQQASRPVWTSWCYAHGSIPSLFCIQSAWHRFRADGVSSRVRRYHCLLRELELFFYALNLTGEDAHDIYSDIGWKFVDGVEDVVARIKFHAQFEANVQIKKIYTWKHWDYFSMAFKHFAKKSA